MKKEKPLLRVGGSDSYMDIPTHSGLVGKIMELQWNYLVEISQGDIGE